MPAMTSASVQECSASACRTSPSCCWVASFGTTMPAAALPAGGRDVGGEPRRADRVDADQHGARAVRVQRVDRRGGGVAGRPSLSPGATASSRSTIATSGAKPGDLRDHVGPGAWHEQHAADAGQLRHGTLSPPRAQGPVRPAPHHRRPHGHADRLPALVDAAMLERDDPGAGPGPRPPGLDDVGHHVDGVAGEHRGGEVHPGEAEVGHGGAEGQLGDGQADHQAQREQAVHQRPAELGGRPRTPRPGAAAAGSWSSS